MYRATGEKKYLDDAVKLYDEFGVDYIIPWIHNYDWGTKYSGVNVLLFKLTKTAKYKNNAAKFTEYLLNEAPKTPKGLVFLNDWGSLRQAANAVFIALQVQRIVHVFKKVLCL